MAAFFLIVPKVLDIVSNYLKVKPLVWPISLSFGYAVRILSRNKLPTLLSVLSISIGVSLLSVIGQLDKSMKNELVDNSDNKPSLFLFDIQEDQYQPLKDLAELEKVPLNDPSPMIRARLIKKNGIKIKRQKKEEGFTTNEEERKRRFNNRGVNLSYANNLNNSEKIVKGDPFEQSISANDIPQVSLEKDMQSGWI